MTGRINWLALVIASLTSVAAWAELVEREIEYPVAGVTMKSMLIYDSRIDELEQPAAGVLVLGEWWGRNDFAIEQARELARAGYVAFAVDLYGDARSTSHPRMAGQWSKQLLDNLNVWMGRSEMALQVLGKQKQADADRIAAVGYSFGATTVLKMAYHGMDLKASIAFYSSLPVPAQSQYEKIKARLLVLHGAADPYVKADALTAFTQTMSQLKQVDWTMVWYGGAQHSFVNPDADRAAMDGVSYDAAAEAKARKHMMQCLTDAIGKPASLSE